MDEAWQPASDLPPALALRRLILGHRVTQVIATAAQRGETLTRQLLTFSRRQTLTPQVIDLSRRLPELKEMRSRSLRGDIETDVVVPDDRLIGPTSSKSSMK